MYKTMHRSVYNPAATVYNMDEEMDVQSTYFYIM